MCKINLLCICSKSVCDLYKNHYWQFIAIGKLWSRSLKLAYTLLNKLGTKTEPVLQPGDRVKVIQRQLRTSG